MVIYEAFQNLPSSNKSHIGLGLKKHAKSYSKLNIFGDLLRNGSRADLAIHSVLVTYGIDNSDLKEHQ